MRICIFCGSSAGNDPKFAEAAVATGRLLAREGVGIVYGGGKVGLMGIVADAALAAGGSVTGIIPQSLVDSELAHAGLTDLHVVTSMHDRKTMMADLSDGFIALPGGAGTLEEIFEQWTWGQLGIHTKPCGFLDVDGYYRPIGEMVARMVENGFLKPEYAAMLRFETDPAALLAAFRAYVPPPRKWLPDAGKVKA
ncbi:TIGR00730 family Rossman fold protein [Microbaculum marinum]